MMPAARYSAMNKTTGGTGPSSMMAAIMVTAATCDQNEKLETQRTTVYPSKDISKLKISSNGNSYMQNKPIQTKPNQLSEHTLSLTHPLFTQNFIFESSFSSFLPSNSYFLTIISVGRDFYLTFYPCLPWFLFRFGSGFDLKSVYSHLFLFFFVFVSISLVLIYSVCVWVSDFFWSFCRLISRSHLLFNWILLGHDFYGFSFYK